METEIPTTAASTSKPLSFNRRQLMTLSSLAVACAFAPARQTAADPIAEVSSSEEAIHQVRLFAAARKRVYAALTVEQQFDKIVQLSGVMKSDSNSKMPTRLSPRVGGTFSLFAGHIVGTQLELVPDELIVQAWRAADWPRGAYSIARFELSEQGGATRIVFDHRAFPKGAGEHLAAGWQAHYWDPLTRLLA